MSNPNAVKLSSTDSARKIIEVVRGSYNECADLHEKEGVRDYPEVYLPRLTAEAVEFLASKIAELEKANKKLSSRIKALEANK